MSTIDLYAVLGIARDASTDEVRDAWKGAVADLDPTDPKLNVFNQAGAVLLDPVKRAKYDAGLAEEDSASDDVAPEAGPAVAAGSAGPDKGPARLRARSLPPSGAGKALPRADGDGRSGDAVAAQGLVASSALLVTLAVLTVAAVLAAVITGPDTCADGAFCRS